MQALSAMLLEGRGSLDHIGSVVDQVVGEGVWPAGRETWIVAMDFDTGARVPFGRDDAPATDLASAVKASCAIPGWYAPVVINGRRYVDGGAVSPTSLDLVAGGGLDVVYVLAPMSSLGQRPGTAGGRVEHYLRSVVTRRLRKDAATVRAAGTQVVLLGPTAEDLDAFGANVMDPSRRARVLETSLRTMPASVRLALASELPEAG
jgi:NTE family protein